MKRLLVALLLIITACEGTINGDKLSKSDIKRIQDLGLLERDEKIIKFYRYYKNSGASFFTNIRIAQYSLDKNDETKNEINSAFYQDIISIDSVCWLGSTYLPYMTITKRDSSVFKAYFEGNEVESRKIFREAIDIWHSKGR